MKTYRWLKCRKGFFGAMLLFAALGGGNAAVAAPAQCEMQLTVELWPEVPDPSDAQFLASLLSDHVSYRLTLQQQRDSTEVVLNLAGPGPGDRCQDVVETMRKDARVLSVRLENPYLTGLDDDDEVQGVAVVAAPLLSEETPPTHLSTNGFGSFYWAFQHPKQAWRISFPIRANDISGASTNVAASCVAFPELPNDAPQC